MSVLVDTSVWSLALRRGAPSNDSVVMELKSLIKESRAVLIGPVRQELLSGIKKEKQYFELRDRLRAFPEVGILAEDYETAANFFNICRRNGVQGSNTDFLLCSVSSRRDLPVFTTDKDFEQFKKHLKFRIYRLQGE